MDKFILILMTMTPNPDGVPGHYVEKKASGPWDELTCRLLEYESNELASKNSLPHAQIAYCRRLDAATVEYLEKLKAKKEVDS
jgi:hypothetical protein